MIKKYKNGNIDIKILGLSSVFDLYHDDEIFMADLIWHSSYVDGWCYLLDTNKMLYYSVNNYGYDKRNDILKGELVKFSGAKEFTYPVEKGIDGYIDEDGNEF